MGQFIIDGLKNGLTAENIKKFATKIFSGVTDGALSAWSDIKGVFAGGFDSAKSLFSSLGDGIKDFFKFDAKAVGKGVQQWRGVATKALMMTGQYSEANLQRLLYQMQTESGGNPRAINLWDINAKRGIPSKGLMQVIDPTFRAYAMDGYDKNVYDPLSNIIASIRYAVSRYGSLANAYKGKGYATGGIFKGTKEGSLIRMAENGGDEAVLPLSNKTRMKPFAHAVASMMPNEEAQGNVTNNFNIASLVVREEADVKKIAKELAREQQKVNRAGGIK